MGLHQTLYDLTEHLMEFPREVTEEFPLEFGVTGSRGYTHLGAVALALGAVASRYPNAVMHNGNCPDGADRLCLETWPYMGDGRGYLHTPLFHIYGSPRAYHVRNESIVARAEFLLAFRKGETPGTTSTINFAKERNIPIFIFEEN